MNLGAFDFVREKTLTCYNGIIADGCGECPACKLRKKGLEELLRQDERNDKLCTVFALLTNYKK